VARQFGQWVVRRPLKEGGQAHTFLVYSVDDREQRPFVLKRLKNKKRLGRFKREVRAGLALSHPNILKVVDSELEKPEPYLVAQFCSGGSLDAVCVSRLSTVERLNLFAGICRGVGYAHSEGVIHRDLKPENVFLLEDLVTPVVGDFGLCFIADEGERFTMVDEAVGARWYMAPELAHGYAEEITPASDVYSLGKILYWILAGRVFDREMHRAQRFDLTKGQIAPDYHFIYELLDKMIVEDPSKRLTNANDVTNSVGDIIRRIEMHSHDIDLASPQACTYCGVGFYKIVLDASRKTEGGNLVSSVQNFGFYGGLDDPEWLILVCDYCANVQIFRPDLAKDRDIWRKK
jgi:serine/threonine protein kinase